jgi:2-dehydropantoate 2-reductase
MNITIVGIGGIGGFLGVKLAKAYADGSAHRVYFLARGEHLAAIRKNGLTLITGGETIVAKPWDAAEDPSGWPAMDQILLCVKGYHLEEAVRSVEPLVAANTLILPLQNGIGKRERVEAILSRGLVGDGAIYVAANIRSPGVVAHEGGPGRVVFGRDARDVETLSPHLEILRSAGIRTELVAEVGREIWAKFVVLCALAGTTSLYGVPIVQVLTDPERSRMLEGLMKEVASLAKAHGVELPQDILGRSMAVARSFSPEAKTSLLNDLERGRPHELDWLLGSAIEQGERLGVEVPLLRGAYDGIRARWRLSSPEGS